MLKWVNPSRGALMPLPVVHVQALHMINFKIWVLIASTNTADDGFAVNDVINLKKLLSVSSV